MMLQATLLTLVLRDKWANIDFVVNLEKKILHN